MSTILTISDMHLPYQHKNAFDFIKQLLDLYQPDLVINMGDLADMHRWGRWASNPDAMGQVEELDKTIELIQELGEIVPDMVECVGNHTLRFDKQARAAGIGSKFLRSIQEIFEYPDGWQVVSKYIHKGEECGDILFMHGDTYTGKYAALKAAEDQRTNTVIGHIHSFAGVMYSANFNSMIWGMNTGCLVDINSLGMEYGKHFPKKPCIGTGVIVDGVPVFEPLREKDYV